MFPRTTRTAINWIEIEKELLAAVPRYSDRKYIKKHLFAEWLIENKDTYPHLTKGYVKNFDCASRTAIMHRVTTCVTRLGWKWHTNSARVFINPFCVEETIFTPLNAPVLQE